MFFSVGNYLSPFKKGLNNVTVLNGNVNGPIMNGWIDTEASNMLKISNNSSVTENTQENFEVSNFNMNENSSYYGATTGGTAVNIYSGNFNVKNGAVVKLIPMRSEIGQSTGGDTANGIYLQAGNLNIQKGGKIVIVPKGSNGSSVISAAQALYNKGSVTIDGGLLYIDIGSVPSVGNANYISGNVTVKNDGLFSIDAKNLGTFGGYVLNSSGILNITNRGNFSIVTDGSGINPYLLANGGPLNINNPGNNVTLQIKPVNGQPGSGQLFTNTINAYSVKYAINNNGNATNPGSNNYYQVQLPSSGIIQTTSTDGTSVLPLVNSNDSTVGAKYLSFSGTPNMSFVNKIGVQVDNSNYIVYGKVVLNNLPSSVDASKDNGIGYLQIYSDGKLLNDSSIKNGTLTLIHKNADGTITTTNIPVGDINNSSNFVHSGNVNANAVIDSSGNFKQVSYSDGIRIPQNASNGDIIRFSYVLPKKPQNNVSVQSHYFVTDQKQTVDINGNFNNYLENPIKGEDTIDSSQVNNGSMIPSITFDDARNKGYSDGQSDSEYYVSTTPQPSNTKYYAGLNDEDVKEIYTDAYNESFNNYKKGQNDYVSNDKNNDEIGSLASNAYNNGYASISAANSAAQSNFYAGNSKGNSYKGLQFSAYNDAYNAASQAVTNYNNGNGSKGSYAGNNSSAKTVYNNIYDSLSNAANSAQNDFYSNGNPSKNYSTDNGSYFGAVYSSAYTDVSNAADSAAADFRNKMSSSAYSNATNTYAAAEAYRKAYTAYSQAWTDFNNGSKQSNSALSYAGTNYTNYSNEYDALVNASQAGNKAYFEKGSSSSSYGDMAANKAYENAYNNAQTLVT
uniref:hypothetical protein n=1 Tax=Apilactobacillus ozensis TaxID=866801 RepID=UPI000A7CECF9